MRKNQKGEETKRTVERSGEGERERAEEKISLSKEREILRQLSCS